MPVLVTTSPAPLGFLLDVRIETQRSLPAEVVRYGGEVIEATSDHVIARFQDPVDASYAAVALAGADPVTFNSLIVSTAGSELLLGAALPASWLTPLLARRSPGGFIAVDGVEQPYAEQDVVEQRISVPSLWHVTHGQIELLAPAHGPLVPLRADKFGIGRKQKNRSENHLVINDSFTSRDHAFIARVDDRWQITDWGTVGGTHVDGVSVERDCRLVTGSRIGIGRAVFVALGL